MATIRKHEETTLIEFLANYSMFLLEVATIVVAILVVCAGITAITAKNKGHAAGKLAIKKISEKFFNYAKILSETTNSKSQSKQLKREAKAQQKRATTQARLFIIDFHGDIKASALNGLREEITAIIVGAKPNDECLVRLESGGGMVNAYGLAASQLMRLKAAGVKLHIAVDKIAASGGYMMACIADHLIAAPFAIIGSIGVIAQLPNFHRFLEKKYIDFEQLTAGQYKRTLTMFGENTKKGREKLQDEINDTHELFKSFIKSQRQQIDIDQVATGEHWFASHALDLKLIDTIQSSDDFLLQRRSEFAMYHIQYKQKKSLMKRLQQSSQHAFTKLLNGNPNGGQDYIG